MKVFFMSCMRVFSFITVLLLNAQCIAATAQNPSLHELAQFAELSYKTLNVGLLDGQADRPESVTLEGVNIRTVMSYGDHGKTLADFFYETRTGFNAYIMEYKDAIFVAMRGTQNPLHVLLDIHIMIEGAKADPEAILRPYLGTSASVATKGIQVVGAIARYAMRDKVSGEATSATTPAPAEEESWVGLLGSAVLEAVPSLVPDEVSGFYDIYTRGDATKLSEAVATRFQHALTQANDCLKEALKIAKDRPIHVIGHSLGGALATVSAVNFRAARSCNLDVTTFCAPGSRGLLKGIDVPEGLSITNYGRSNDVVHIFGEHVGTKELLMSRLLSPALAEKQTDYSWYNPMGWFDSGKSAFQSLYTNHSMGKVLEDLSPEATDKLAAERGHASAGKESGAGAAGSEDIGAN